MSNQNTVVIYGTTAQWDAQVEIIPGGKFCVEFLANGSAKFKLADGVHPYSQLPYYENGAAGMVLQPFATATSYAEGALILHNDEIRIAKVAFSSTGSFNEADWLRAGNCYTKAEIDTLLNAKADATALNFSTVSGITAAQNTSELKLQASVYNPSTQTTSTTDVALPLATTTQPGIMPSASVTALQTLDARVASLEAGAATYSVDFTAATYSVSDPQNPSQAECATIYNTLSSGAALVDGVKLVDDGQGFAMTYYLSQTSWVKGSTLAPSYSQGVWTTDKTNVSPVTDHITEAEKVKDDYGGHQAEKEILNLKVTKNGSLQTIEGLSINGVRIDFDHNSLTIENAFVQDKYSLTNGPYKITSSYASLEAYGRLFIFDEEVAGKGIIRNSSDNTIDEVTDLGIYAPSSSINVIHVIDRDDVDVCYIVSEATQNTILIIYPDGSYKTTTLPNASLTPQNISDLRLLTSLDNTRHSLFMYQYHPLGGTTYTAQTAYYLLQLQDATVKVLDATTPECSGYTSAGTFDPTRPLNLAFSWEAHTDIPDPDFSSSHANVIATNYADNQTGNRRHPYPTGAWNSEAGSARKDRRKLAKHNGIYYHDKGALILNNYDTNVQNVLVTPEGFIGWFRFEGLSYEYYKTFREIELKSGPYAGKRALFYYSVSHAQQQTFIVNTPDGDPTKTVIVNLTTNLQNLNHLSGKNVIAAAFNSYPTFPWTTWNRILACLQEDADNPRFITYINQSEITPNTYDPSGVPTKNFDWHVIDAVLDTGYASATFLARAWKGLYRFEPSNMNGTAGTLVIGFGSTASLFIPDANDTWDGTTGIRPYFVQHPDNVTSQNDWDTTVASNWVNYSTARVFWHNHFICGITGNVTYSLDYYFNAATQKYVCRKITHGVAYAYLPVILDNKHLVFLNGENAAGAAALTWDDVAQDFTYAALPSAPRTSNGNIHYLKVVTQDQYDTGLRNKLYFFDSRTARSDYIALTYSESGGNSSFAWSTHALPASLITGHILSVPSSKTENVASGRILLFSKAASNIVYNLLLEGSSYSANLGDSALFRHIWDISNRSNPDESPWGAYLCVTEADAAFVYVLDWDYSASMPIFTKYVKRSNAACRIWGLPDANILVSGNPTNVARFAIGGNEAVAGTASSPFAMITRIGGTVDNNNPTPTDFTTVRDFGTAIGGTAARVDLAVPAKTWYEPHIVPHQPNVVRFLGIKTPHIGSNYAQSQQCEMLGYKYDSVGNPTPVYGEQENLKYDTQSGLGSEVGEIDNYLIEIGVTPERDSMIYFGVAFGHAIKVADGWEAHPQNTLFATDSIFKGGPQATIWEHRGSGDSYHDRNLDRVVIVNEIVSSSVTGHLPGQYTHEMATTLAATNFITDYYGGSAFVPVIRKHRLFYKCYTQTRLANWSPNETVSIIDPNINLPYSAWAANEYIAFRGAAVSPNTEVTARTPLFQYWDNQIVPGIYRRRNNQFVNQNSANGVVPYFQFTDDKCDMVFMAINGTTQLAGIKPFYDEVKTSHPRLDPNGKIYISREKYDFSTGDTEVMQFFIVNGQGRYKEITIPKNFEFISRLTYLNGYIELLGVSKRRQIDVTTDQVYTSDQLPDTLSVLDFDKGVELLSFHTNDGEELSVYLVNNLVFKYQGNAFYTLTLEDLKVLGNNYFENLSVLKSLAASHVRAAEVEADRILVKSSYDTVLFN